MPNNFELTQSLDAYGHLWIAVLRQGIDDATCKAATAESRVEQRRARLWIRDQRFFTGSFRWICSVLDIDPEAVLREVQRRLRRGGIGRRKKVFSNTFTRGAHP